MSTVLNAKGVPAFFFIQDTAQATWLIPHGLNKRVVLDVMVDHKGQLTKIIPKEILFTSPNHTTVIFSKPMSGRAFVT